MNLEEPSLWHMTPYRLVNNYLRFEGACCLFLQGLLNARRDSEDGSCEFLRNACNCVPVNTTSGRRRLKSSLSQLWHLQISQNESPRRLKPQISLQQAFDKRTLNLVASFVSRLSESDPKKFAQVRHFDSRSKRVYLDWGFLRFLSIIRGKYGIIPISRPRPLPFTHFWICYPKATSIFDTIQGDSGGRVNILGGDSVGDMIKEFIWTCVSNSESLPT